MTRSPSWDSHFPCCHFCLCGCLFPPNYKNRPIFDSLLTSSPMPLNLCARNLHWSCIPDSFLFSIAIFLLLPLRWFKHYTMSWPQFLSSTLVVLQKEWSSPGSCLFVSEVAPSIISTCSFVADSIKITLLKPERQGPLWTGFSLTF